MQISVEAMYGEIGIDEATIETLVNRSLAPRPSTLLYDKMGKLGLNERQLLLDIGCRDARHTCELVKRYGCRAIGIDPVDRHLKLCAETIADFGFAEQVVVRKGAIEALPVESESIDFIWCRDVLTHVSNLPQAFAECARVLKTGGKMLIYQTFASDRLAASEADWLFPRLAVVAENMSFATVQAALAPSGLTLVEKDEIGSEWREWWEENGVNTSSKQLLQIARMQRDRERLVGELGELVYENELANCYWGVAQMLGKLVPVNYLVAKL